MNDDDDNHAFDPEQAVATYRQVIAHLECATTDERRAEFRGIAQRLCRQWKELQGEDSLHAMSFGEPE